MTEMLDVGGVRGDDVIDDLGGAGDTGESDVSAPVVLGAAGRESHGGPEEPVPPERGDKAGEILIGLVERDLKVTRSGVQGGEKAGT